MINKVDNGERQTKILRESCRCLFEQRSNLDRKSKLSNIGRIINVCKVNSALAIQHAYILMKSVRNILEDGDTTIRAAGFRALRHVILNRNAIQLFLHLHLDLYIVRAFDREQSYLWERLQALKCVRRILKLDGLLFPASVVQSIIAVISSDKDNCRRIALETLRELALANVLLVAQCDGIRTLVDSILDPSLQDFAEPIIYTILHLLNDDTTRSYVRNSLDINVLFAPLTETDVPAGAERRQKWKSSRLAIVTMMRSWPGIILLTAEAKGGLRALVELLVHPVEVDIKKAILSTIFEVFYLEHPFERQKASNCNYALKDNFEKDIRLSNPSDCSSNPQLQSIPPHNILDNYMVIVLLAFVHCDLLDALISLGIGDDGELCKPATKLLSEILRIASRLLPEEHCAKLLALPALVNVASAVGRSPTENRFQSPVEKWPKKNYSYGNHYQDKSKDRYESISSSEMLIALAEAVNSVLRLRARNVNYAPAYASGVHLASEVLRGTNRPLHHTPESLVLYGSSRERIVFDLKASMDSKIDDSTFKDMLYSRSRVLLGKDWFKWDWVIISELLEGPLTNPTRLSEAMKTKFFQRLSGFFRCDPGNKGYFAQLPWIPDYLPYIRPACRMYTLLLSHPEGLAFLKTDRRGQLLSEIASALELEARPEAAIVESHIGALQARMFSPEFCSRRMLREYFTLLGLMSSSKEGLRLLEQSNLFQRLYKMGKMQGHDFLCRLILSNLDYSVDGSSRNLLQSWMSEGSQPLRLYATCLLRALLRSGEVDFASWGIDALVAQLEQEEEVALAALSVLEEAAQTPQYLLAMIMKRPRKLVDMPSAKNLLLRFISLPEGFAFLHEMNWIPPRLKEWRDTGYLTYIHKIEQSLSCVLNQHAEESPARSDSFSSFTGPVPIPVLAPLGNSGNRAENFTSYGNRGLEWLFRLPWNMEVRMFGPSGSGPPSNLTLDTFVDASKIRFKPEAINICDSSGSLYDVNSIKIRGIVVDARNLPHPVLVTSEQTLQACLFLGTQPVDRRGFTKPSPQSNGGYILSYNNDAAGNSRDEGGRHGLKSTYTDGEYYGENSNSPFGGSEMYNNPSESQKDWSTCSPEQRENSLLKPPECSIYTTGECALWNFAVEELGSKNSEKGQDSSKGVKRRTWLKSIDFVIKLYPQYRATVFSPPHLYGELSKTNFGCKLLKDSGHIAEFLEILRNPASVPLERRAAISALGFISATARGFEMIKKRSDDFLEFLLDGVSKLELLSLRGACFYSLGLVSRSGPGRRALALYGWESPRSPQATISLPQDTSKLFKVYNYNYVGSPASLSEITMCSLPLIDIKNEWKDILRLVGNLSSHITFKEAHATLLRMKSTKSKHFESPELRIHVFRLLQVYHFSLSARRFINELFEKACLSNADWSRMKRSSARLHSDSTFSTSSRSTWKLKVQMEEQSISVEPSVLVEISNVKIQSGTMFLDEFIIRNRGRNEQLVFVGGNMTFV